MIVIPTTKYYNYNSSRLIELLEQDIKQFIKCTSDCVAYFDYANSAFVCELQPEQELLFILKHPRYERYHING